MPTVKTQSKVKTLSVSQQLSDAAKTGSRNSDLQASRVTNNDRFTKIPGGPIKGTLPVDLNLKG